MRKRSRAGTAAASVWGRGGHGDGGSCVLAVRGEYMKDHIIYIYIYIYMIGCGVTVELL